MLDLLLYHSLIFIVRADPDPNEVVTILNCKRPYNPFRLVPTNLPTFLK